MKLKVGGSTGIFFKTLCYYWLFIRFGLFNALLSKTRHSLPGIKKLKIHRQDQSSKTFFQNVSWFFINLSYYCHFVIFCHLRGENCKLVLKMGIPPTVRPPFCPFWENTGPATLSYLPAVDCLFSFFISLPLWLKCSRARKSSPNNRRLLSNPNRLSQGGQVAGSEIGQFRK